MPATEQPIPVEPARSGLPFEDEPWSKWVGGGGFARLSAAVLRRNQRKQSGAYVPPVPWTGIGIAVRGFVAVAGTIALVAWLAALR